MLLYTAVNSVNLIFNVIREAALTMAAESGYFDMEYQLKGNLSLCVSSRGTFWIYLGSVQSMGSGT